jgi:hypothetical protein
MACTVGEGLCALPAVIWAAGTTSSATIATKAAVPRPAHASRTSFFRLSFLAFTPEAILSAIPGVGFKLSGRFSGSQPFIKAS